MASASAPSPTTTAPSPSRAYWLKTLLKWHWISSALCLVGMLLFTVTGFTLNHAGQIEARPVVTQRELQLPAPLQAALEAVPLPQDKQAPPPPLPPAVLSWLEAQLPVRLGQHPVEWSAEEAYIPLPRPGGDAWLRIARDSGEVEYEATDRGWISYFNDLHKGRHTGTAWSWFIDLFAAACLVFCLTGLVILKMHALNRPSTWPLLAMGLVIPLLLALLFIH